MVITTYIRSNIIIPTIASRSFVITAARALISLSRLNTSTPMAARIRIARIERCNIGKQYIQLRVFVLNPCKCMWICSCACSRVFECMFMCLGGIFFAHTKQQIIIGAIVSADVLLRYCVPPRSFLGPIINTHSDAFPGIIKEICRIKNTFHCDSIERIATVTHLSDGSNQFGLRKIVQVE